MSAAAAAARGHSWRISTSVSQSTRWGTPPAIYASLDQEFGFTLDAAADCANAKHVRFFTKDTDALRASWAGEVVFCNPPYGRDMGAWVAKALQEAEQGATVVMLLPARTDVAWFHDYVLPHAEIRFIRGRLGFTLGNVATNRGARAPFASMVAIFYPGVRGDGNGVIQHVFPFMPRTTEHTNGEP